MCVSDKITVTTGAKVTAANDSGINDVEALILDQPCFCMDSLSDDQTSVKSEDPPSPRLKFLCSYGGKILPRPPDHQLRYAGGETRVVVLNRDISYMGLMVKLRKLAGADVCLRYKLPHEDLDALVSVVSDEDIQNMMDEYEKADFLECSCRIRLFLFLKKLQPVRFNEDTAADRRKVEEQFLEAVNGVAIIGKTQKSENSSFGNISKELHLTWPPSSSPCAAFSRGPLPLSDPSSATPSLRARAMPLYSPLVGHRQLVPPSLEMPKPLKYPLMERKHLHQIPVQNNARINSSANKAPECYDVYDLDHNSSSGSSSASPQEFRRDRRPNTGEPEPEKYMIRYPQEQFSPKERFSHFYDPILQEGFPIQSQMKAQFSVRTSAFSGVSPPEFVPPRSIFQVCGDDSLSYTVASPRRITLMSAIPYEPACKTDAVCREQPCLSDCCSVRGSKCCRFCDQSAHHDRKFMPQTSLSDSSQKDHQNSATVIHKPSAAVQSYKRELHDYSPFESGAGTAGRCDYGPNQNDFCLCLPQQQHGSKQVILY